MSLEQVSFVKKSVLLSIFKGQDAPKAIPYCPFPIPKRGTLGQSLIA